MTDKMISLESVRKALQDTGIDEFTRGNKEAPTTMALFSRYFCLAEGLNLLEFKKSVVPSDVREKLGY